MFPPPSTVTGTVPVSWRLSCGVFVVLKLLFSVYEAFVLFELEYVRNGEDIERGGGGGGGEVSVWDQTWKRERDGDGRGDMRKRQHSRDGQ